VNSSGLPCVLWRISVVCCSGLQRVQKVACVGKCYGVFMFEYVAVCCSVRASAVRPYHTHTHTHIHTHTHTHIHKSHTHTHTHTPTHFYTCGAHESKIYIQVGLETAGILLQKMVGPRASTLWAVALLVCFPPKKK